MPKFNFTKFTDEELDELSEITTADILRAHQRTIQGLGQRFKNLLLAIRDSIFKEGNDE